MDHDEAGMEKVTVSMLSQPNSATKKPSIHHSFDPQLQAKHQSFQSHIHDYRQGKGSEAKGRLETDVQPQPT
jgi:hypothetical protein